VVCAIGVLLTLACTDSDVGQPTAIVSDSSGVRTVYLAPVADSLIPLWQSEPLFDTSEDARAYLLDAGWLGARFGPDSGLLIANVDELRTRRQTDTSAILLARRGDGPNEFRSISHLGVAEDGNPFVVEGLGQRLSRIGWNGKRTGLATGRVGSSGDWLLPVSVLSGNSYVAVPFQWRPNSGGAGGFMVGSLLRDSVPLLVHSWDGREPPETLGLWPGVERGAGFVVPFARSALYAGRGAATVIGVTDSLDLWLFTGRTLQLRLTGPYRRREPTAADQAAWDALVSEEIDPALPPHLWALPEFRAQLPEIGGFAVDEASNIWVGDYAVPGQAMRRWRVFSNGGELLGRLDLPVVQSAYFPSRHELLDVRGDRIAVLREAADGALYIEVRRVRR
jgi:hypothetical protein